jgi:hypothetical protein
MLAAVVPQAPSPQTDECCATRGSHFSSWRCRPRVYSDCGRRNSQVVGVFLALDNANEAARREFEVGVLIAAGLLEEDANDYEEQSEDGTVKYSAPDLRGGGGEPAVVYVEAHPLTDAYDEEEEEDEEQAEGAPADAHAAYPPPEDEEDDDFADEEDVDDFEGDEEEDEAPPPGAKRKKM